MLGQAGSFIRRSLSSITSSQHQPSRLITTTNLDIERYFPSIESDDSTACVFAVSLNVEPIKLSHVSSRLVNVKKN